MSDNLRKLNVKTQTHRYWLDVMSQSKYVNEKHDAYNQGPLIDKLEGRVADLLGKEKALFFHKGVTAQLVALKVAAELRKNNKVILHPNSHIAGDEKNAYQALMGFRGIELGKSFQPFNFSDVSQLTESAASLVVEMPLRRAGFKLTPWNHLARMQKWAQQQDTHFHMDGARLWESTHYYQKSLAEIAAVFDSVYVSFYKGIGGLSGAALAGDSEFIENCRVWRSRMGGDLYSAFPMLITALEGLDHSLKKIPSWVKRAHEIAEKLNALDKVHVDKPHTNGFLVFVEGSLEDLNSRIKALNEKFNMALIFRFEATEVSDVQKTEMQVGAGAQEISNQEIIDYFESLLCW